MNKQHRNSESDEQLVQAILAGDLDSFGILVHRHDALVRRCVHRCVSDDTMVEEAVQETWCQSFRRLKDLVQPQRLASWLRRIATNCALEQGRRRSKTMSLSETKEVSAPTQSEDSGWIWELVDSMPPEMAVILTRHYRRGESYEEIARALDIKRSTVRGRIFLARNELKRRLGGKPCIDK